MIQRLPNDISMLIDKQLHKDKIDRLNEEYKRRVRVIYTNETGSFYSVYLDQFEFNWRIITGCLVYKYGITSPMYVNIYNIHSHQSLEDASLPRRYTFSCSDNVPDEG